MRGPTLTSTRSIETTARRAHLPAGLVRTFARLDPRALGIAVGTVAGLWLMLGTLILVLRGDEFVGSHLWLLAHFFIGYEVTFRGSAIGFLYGGLIGFLAGYSFAWLRNKVAALYLHLMRRRGEQQVLDDLLDRVG